MLPFRPKASAYAKGRVLLEADCVFSDFGTRRRRSFRAQEIVIKALIQASKDIDGKRASFSTSNVSICYLLACF